uniref:Ig-like domain-containing protein n=1 Tax=Oryzias sinensis TaxID=183150 RepID=A0A8C7Y3J5_9TELE
MSSSLTASRHNGRVQFPTCLLADVVSSACCCFHTKGASYYQMYWYRQLPGETMELVVFTSTANSGEHDFGAFSKEQFSASKTEAERGTFTVKKVQPEDKGLYFCAVSQHSDTNP